MATPWAKNVLHFHLNKLFGTRFVFWLGNYFGYFSNNLANFFPIFWSPWSTITKALDCDTTIKYF